MPIPFSWRCSQAPCPAPGRRSPRNPPYYRRGGVCARVLWVRVHGVSTAEKAPIAPPKCLNSCDRWLRSRNRDLRRACRGELGPITVFAYREDSRFRNDGVEWFVIGVRSTIGERAGLDRGLVRVEHDSSFPREIDHKPRMKERKMIETSQVGQEPMQRPLGQSSSRPLRGTEWQRWELQAATARPRYPSLTGVGARKVLRNEEPRADISGGLVRGECRPSQRVFCPPRLTKEEGRRG